MPCSKIIATSDQLKQIIADLAHKISSDYCSLENCLALVVLEGAKTFSEDLLAKMNFPIETTTIKAASYEGTRSTGQVKIDAASGLVNKIRNKNILLIDDIYDTGQTLSSIIKWLKNCNPKSIRTCALLEKQTQHAKAVNVDYIGMKIEDDFVVGYGLDYNGIYRNLPYIGVLSEKNQKP